MDTKEIQQMFSEMGLGSFEQRDKLVKDLSINLDESNNESTFEIKTCTNTLKSEHYA